MGAAEGTFEFYLELKKRSSVAKNLDKNSYTFLDKNSYNGFHICQYSERYPNICQDVQDVVVFLR